MSMNFWQQRSKRERWLLMLLLTTLLSLASYQGLYLPWQQHQQSLKASILQQQLKWRWLQQHSYAFTPTNKQAPSLQAKTLIAQIQSIAPNARTTIQPQGHSATITLSSIPYPALIQLLAHWHQEGDGITTLRIERTSHDTVTAHITLQSI